MCLHTRSRWPHQHTASFFLLLSFDQEPGEQASPRLAGGLGLLLSGSEFIISNPLASKSAAPQKSVRSRESSPPSPVPGSALPLFGVNY